jgi:hypothetical protein
VNHAVPLYPWAVRNSFIPNPLLKGRFVSVGKERLCPEGNAAKKEKRREAPGAKSSTQKYTNKVKR